MRNARWITVAAALVIGAAAALAQTEGPIQVKRPPPRPPRTERAPDPAQSPPRRTPQDRPELRRRAESPEKPEPGAKAESGSPCPAGYIPKPATAEAPPRLTRTSADSSVKQGPAATSEVECVYSEVVVDEDGKVIERHGGPEADPLIEEARLAVFTFSETLPDFLCTQVTSRYQAKSLQGKWNLRDRISAELLYADGKEYYQDYRRNGKEVRRHPRHSGSWSTGEFGTLMQDVFHPGTAAHFAPARDDRLAGRPAKAFDYSVEQKRSHWKIDYEGQVIYPAYKGAVWIDPESKRVLRIEMQAVDVPASYPMESIALMVEYGDVLIGEQKHLLPVRSESQACKRYAGGCSKNAIEFRDYRKFTAESSISTVESNVTFEGAAEEPEKKEP